MSEEEKNSIEYLKARLYGNKGCKYIDVAQEDLRRIIKLIDVKEKGLKQANKIITEQDNEISELNNKICSLEFKVENQQKKIEELMKDLDEEKEKNKNLIDPKKAIFSYSIDSENKVIVLHDYVSKDKIREKQNKYKKKIEKLENKKIWNEPVDTINKNRYINYFNAYEELLEEGEEND